MYDQQYHDPYKNPPPQQQPYGYPPPQQQQQQYYGQQPAATAQPYMGGGQATNYTQQHSNAQEVTALKPEQAPAGACRDWPFALLFILNVVAIVGCLVVWGLDAIKDDSSSSSSKSNTLLTPKETKNVIGIALAMAVFAVVLALASVKLIVAYAACMILFTLWFNVAVAVLMAAFGFYMKNYVLGVIGAIFALLSFCYARAVQHRIPFAVANLRVAAAAISKHCSTYIVSLTFTIIQIVWVVVWSLALLGVSNQLAETNNSSSGKLTSGSICRANSDCESNSCRYYGNTRQCYGSSQTTFYKQSPQGYAAYFFLLISFYWGVQVFKNVSHTTIAGTVATFWYNAESAGATGSSLKRSMTTSFGSICFGSLLVAIIQALRQLAEQSREEGGFMGCICECILGCLQSLMEYINRWAFVYVGIYGYKFTQAGKAVFELFHQRGFDAIINDDLIGNVLGFAALAVGLICAGAGAAIAEYTDIVNFQNATVILAVLGLVIGIGVAITPLSVIDSSVATIFVCFAEDPAAFAQSHPELYQPLITEWHNLYPEIMVQAGYWH